MNIPKVNWILLGTIIGSFWGILAVLFNAPPLRWKKLINVVRSFFIILFQFFFNFIGGFAGCVGIGLFLDRYSHGNFGVPELILLGIALVGVSGKLSDIIYKIPGFMNEMVKSKAPKT
jgi:hypothetical protein